MHTMKLVKTMVLVNIIGGLFLMGEKKVSVKSEKTIVDLLVNNGIILTMNQKKDIIEEGAIAIHDGKIVAVGPADHIKQAYSAKEVINADKCVVLPGIINAHTHVPMVFFRGLADDLLLMDWLQALFPVEKRHVTSDFVYWGTKLACYEMIKGGVTTFVDMYYFEDSVAQAAYDVGMRAIVGETIIGFPTPDSKTYKEALTYTESFVKKWKNNPLITPAIAPHSCYTCSKEMLMASKKLSETYNVPLITHISETKTEIEQVLSKHNMRPVEYLDSLGMLNERLIAAHCVYLDDEEIALLKQKKVGVVHCPISNMKIAVGVARVNDLLKAEVPVGLATDGSASNNALDMFGEIKTATLLQKITTGDPTALNVYQTLELATIGGARAIHMDDQIGSLEVGKKADITIVAMDHIHQLPVYNVVSQLVYATKASDVQTVIINGKVVMKNRVLGTENQEDELRKKIEHFRGLIKKSIDCHP